MPTVLRQISQEQGLAALAAVMSQFPAYLEPAAPVCAPPEFVPCYGERQCAAIVWPSGPADWTRHAFVGWRNTVAYRRLLAEGVDEAEATAAASRNRVDPPAGVAFEPIDDVAIALLAQESMPCAR